MQTTYSQQIEIIGDLKVISRHARKRTPQLTFASLDRDDQIKLLMLLVDENSEAIESLLEKIDSDIEDAYCAVLRVSEAEDDAIDMRRFKREDEEERARDMNESFKQNNDFNNFIAGRY